MGDNSVYENLLSFWNTAFQFEEAEKVSEKWISDPVFNEVLLRCIPKNGHVLDYGSGAGWLLPEIALTVPISEGIGVEPSANGVAYASQTAVKSGMSEIRYLQGDEAILSAFPEYFDFAGSVNVLDVVPDEVIDRILTKLRGALKPGAYLMICINPDYPAEMLEKAGFIYDGNCMFKDDILRGNKKTRGEWIALLERYFQFTEYHEFALNEREHAYPRRMFLLRK